MVGIDVGDDRDQRIQAQEAAVALVGLGHQPLAAAQARVGAGRQQLAADDEGRVQPAFARARWRPARWWWSCRACRRWRCRAGSASARPAFRRAAPPGCAARGLPCSSGLSALIALDTTTHVGAADVGRGVAAMHASRPCAPAGAWSPLSAGRSRTPGSRACTALRRCRSCRRRRCRRNARAGRPVARSPLSMQAALRIMRMRLLAVRCRRARCRRRVRRHRARERARGFGHRKQSRRIAGSAPQRVRAGCPRAASSCGSSQAPPPRSTRNSAFVAWWSSTALRERHQHAAHAGRAQFGHRQRAGAADTRSAQA